VTHHVIREVAVERLLVEKQTRMTVSAERQMGGTYVVVGAGSRARVVAI